MDDNVHYKPVGVVSAKRQFAINIARQTADGRQSQTRCLNLKVFIYRFCYVMFCFAMAFDRCLIKDYLLTYFSLKTNKIFKIKKR